MVPRASTMLPLSSTRSGPSMSARGRNGGNHDGDAVPLEGAEVVEYLGFRRGAWSRSLIDHASNPASLRMKARYSAYLLSTARYPSS